MRGGSIVEEAGYADNGVEAEEGERRGWVVEVDSAAPEALARTRRRRPADER
jgi:hypothetical protein